MTPAGPFAIANARVAGPDGWIEPGWVLVTDGTIDAVGTGDPPGRARLVDAGGRVVAPGFVDVHVHGGAGAIVNQPGVDEVAAAVRQLAAFHARHGTTALVPTTISDTADALAVAVEGVANCVGPPSGGAEVLGSHLEGPWLSPGRCGAHDPDRLRSPDLGELHHLVERAGGTIRLLTIAPELSGADAVIDGALAAGVVVSIGHTDADYDQASAAIDRGARHVTHLCNAMAPMHHRRPGTVAAALTDPRVSVELIADGHHVHRAVLALVARTAPGRVALVSDAIGAAGLGPGRHRLGPHEVEVRGDRVSLARDHATLAGSVLTMDRAVALIVHQGAMSLFDALRAASRTPAAVVGAGRKGSLEPGHHADIVLLGSDLTTVATLVRGDPVHDPADIFTDLRR